MPLMQPDRNFCRVSSPSSGSACSDMKGRLLRNDRRASFNSSLPTSPLPRTSNTSDTANTTRTNNPDRHLSLCNGSDPKCCVHSLRRLFQCILARSSRAICDSVSWPCISISRSLDGISAPHPVSSSGIFLRKLATRLLQALVLRLEWRASEAGAEEWPANRKVSGVVTLKSWFGAISIEVGRINPPLRNSESNAYRGDRWMDGSW